MYNVDAEREQHEYAMRTLQLERNQLSEQLAGAMATIAHLNAASASNPSAATLKSMLDVANASAANVSLQRDGLQQSIRGYELRIDELERLLHNARNQAAHVNARSIE